MFSIITSNLIWTESPWIVIALAGGAVGGWFFFKPVFFIALLLFLFCFHFFRNPERICPEALIDATVIVSPADGRIVDICHDIDGTLNGHQQKISIFLSPLNVHVNWIPIAGLIEKIEYVPGKFMMAFLPKSSELNEHNDILIRHESGKKIVVRQIAGTIARRIVCWADENQQVGAGQKYGMIKFSSRIDLFLPKKAEICVTVGQSVYGGKTVIGRLL